MHSLAYNLHYKKTFRIFLLIFFVPLLITASVWIFTDTDTLVVFKGVSFIITPLILAIALGYFVWFAYQSKAWKWCKSAAKLAIDRGEEETIRFSEKGLLVEAKNYRTEVQWDYFKYFDEDESTLYLFTADGSLYSCWSFSEKEIGNEEVTQLKVLASTKLQKLVTNNGV